jgi:hypothetical protein
MNELYDGGYAALSVLYTHFIIRPFYGERAPFCLKDTICQRRKISVYIQRSTHAHTKIREHVGDQCTDLKTNVAKLVEKWPNWPDEKECKGPSEWKMPLQGKVN